MSDITELLYRIKENINAVENGDTRAPLLDEIESDFLEFMELTKLFLISVQRRCGRYHIFRPGCLRWKVLLYMMDSS